MTEPFYHTDLTEAIIGAAMKVHTALGPGLLEAAYEECLEYELKKLNLKVEKQKILPLVYEELIINSAYRVDLLVEEKVIIELKSVSELNEIHEAQLLTYLKLSKCKVGLLINFNETRLKKCLRRFVM